MKAELTIEQKLLAISNQIHNVEKDSTNKFHHYDYVSANKLFEKLKPMLAEQGLIIFPSCNSCTESNGLTTIMMNYKIVDTTNEHVQDFIIPGQGQDKGDKGVYKAMTGALKYFLLQLFMISTDDDPEADGDERKERQSVSKSDTTPRFSREERSSNRGRKSDDSSNLESSDKESSSESNPWLWQIEFSENIYAGRYLFEVPLEELKEMSEEFDEVFSKNDAAIVKRALSRDWKKEREKTIQRWRESQREPIQQQFDDDDIPFK